ncbi:xylulokinase [Aliiroseovarius sp. S2029]|uniref:xylulokinase n=1 Tax=Aliiroseovarius sp. S2029 TaxID=2936988 RepID=UPI0020C13FB9|nr:xylulokinase [Aliiroseovarius sp. S2029]MCK8484337.1 xylulokinase [Aliiroseovarius sp. S2029]
MAFLGIDLGTSGLRALLVDAAGSPIGWAEHAYATHHPHPGWSEQNPKDWIDALTSAARELRDAHPEFSGLKGIGVSGHMHGAVLVDETGDPIRPCIMWNDTRSHEEAARLDAMPQTRVISGNVAFPGFTAPKLEWVRAHEPENHARISKVLLPAAYVNWYLTGEYVSDISDCSGTGWLDVRARGWSERLLTAGNMRPDQMPRLVEGCDPAGQLRTELMSDWGINQPVIVAGGAGDNAATACGIGALCEGQGFVSLGTSGVLLLARDGCDPAPETALHCFCHAIPDRWCQMGVMLSATNSLNWLSRISGQSPATLTEALGPDIGKPSDELFLPYLSGERTPHNDAQIRAAFLGLDTQTSLDDMTRAVLNGVAFALRDSAEAMKTTGADINKLYAVGGGAASRYWVELIATILGTSIALPKGGEFGAALGAARLAIVAATDARPEDVMLAPELCEGITPRVDLIQAYDDAYERFRSAYPAVRSAQ